MQWPLRIEFSNPKAVGLEGARNFYLQTDQQVKIGVWWVLQYYEVWNKILLLLFDSFSFYNVVYILVLKTDVFTGKYYHGLYWIILFLQHMKPMKQC